MAAVAEQLGLHERKVLIALEYAAAHRAEIEAQVAANDDALAKPERLASERQRWSSDPVTDRRSCDQIAKNPLVIQRQLVTEWAWPCE